MIGFIGAIFKRMSEVNSVTITARLVSPAAWSAAQQTEQGTGKGGCSLRHLHPPGTPIEGHYSRLATALSRAHSSAQSRPCHHH